MKAKKLLAILFLCVTLAVTAQDFQEEKGNLSFLKDQKVVNVEFKYDNLRLMKDNVTEKEYVDERREYLNNKDKELFQLRSIEAPGDQFGNNFSNESRIGEGFAKTAKSFGKLIVKRLKK